jgi:hypothetical protein
MAVPSPFIVLARKAAAAQSLDPALMCDVVELGIDASDRAVAVEFKGPIDQVASKKL